MNSYDCSHYQLVQIGKKFYCDSCGIEIPVPPHQPLCECNIVHSGNQHKCEICGVEYDEEYLKKAAKKQSNEV